MSKLKIDARFRRRLIKPLVPRKRNNPVISTMETALRALERRGVMDVFLPQFSEAAKAVRNAKPEQRWKDPELARASIALAAALFASGRISSQEYVFLASIAAEGVHDSRTQDGIYDERLAPIADALKAVERQHGLGENEYWPVGNAPPEYVQLNRQYETVLEERFIDVLRELGANGLAALREADLADFERKRERGRRAFAHRDELAAAVEDIVRRYENEAENAASTKAYAAAITLIGAALEGLLLLRCLRAPRKARAVATALPPKRRPRDLGQLERWTFDSLIEVCLAAGWLPPIRTRIVIISPDGLAHELRKMRNYVHPGRLAKERPWIESDEHEYEFATAIYSTLKRTIGRAKDRRQIRDAASKSLLTDDDLIALGLRRE